ncbi:hypothetical protein [Polynucleobacter sp. HIN6]|uniref:hypothetical protein n=1 Tax=Polynucleobacter sp. HIN6 TaxID=3047865 RepID=UPI002572A358|nr:hypothetical protein [Polynucleobacter sp. HIN6]
MQSICAWLPLQWCTFGANQVLDGKKPKSEIMIMDSPQTKYNSFKMVLGGTAIYGDYIQELRKRIEAKDFAGGSRTRSTFDILPIYLNHMISDVKLAYLRKLQLIAAIALVVYLQVNYSGHWAANCKGSVAR